MDTMNIALSIFNFLLLIYNYFGRKIEFIFRWLFPARKIMLKVKDRDYSLHCLRHDLRVIIDATFHEMADSHYRTHDWEGRLEINSVVRSRDISKEIQQAFLAGENIKYVDKTKKEFEIIIIFLSKDGIKTQFDLIGAQSIKGCEIPEGAVLDIKASIGVDYTQKLIKDALLKLTTADWKKIYREKIETVVQLEENR